MRFMLQLEAAVRAYSLCHHRIVLSPPVSLGPIFGMALENYPKPEKGSVFERLTQLYLQTVPEYQTELQRVWLLRDVPADVGRRLKLPPGRDEGIDLIARTRQGKYWCDTSKISW
jgi:hypothetical protein